MSLRIVNVQESTNIKNILISNSDEEISPITQVEDDQLSVDKKGSDDNKNKITSTTNILLLLILIVLALMLIIRISEFFN